MGSQQSRPSDAAIQEKLLERLHALQVKDERSVNEKDGYVFVDSANRTSSRGQPTVAHKQDVSSEAISEWEKELMEDPKVRACSRRSWKFFLLLTPRRTA